jgi:hypothetical protein
MDEFALMQKFREIFHRDSDWSRSHKLARRAGIMIFLHPKKEYDWVTGVRWDPELFVRQPGAEISFEGNNPMAWRRDFVEKVVALGFVPDLESLPAASHSDIP